MSVIIVNYNVKYYLEQCLRSVLKAGESLAIEVIVVDNHSSDGSRQYLEPMFPKVQFVWQSANPGFAKACNLGLAQSKGDYVLFLNPDTLVPEDCFEKLINFFRTQTNAGAVGVRMIDGRGRFLKESKRGYPSTMASFFKLSGLIKIFPRSRFFAKYYLGHLPEFETNKVDILSGAFMAMPAAVATASGGFDEAFFMYGEDIDLSYRITSKGYNNYYVPKISIIHFKGESTSKHSLQYTRNFYKAMEIFVRKYHAGSTTFFYVACIRCVIALKSFFKIFVPAMPKQRELATRLIIISNENDWEAGKQLYQQSVNAALKSGNVIQANIWSNELKKQAAQPGTDILFCIGRLPMSTVIKMLPDVIVSGDIYFHDINSQCMVCSTTG